MRKWGEIQVHMAENAEDALIILNELIELHQKRWANLGYRGAFYSEYSVDFHKRLICSRLSGGEIQLLRIPAGNHTIGCRYCFIYNGTVMGYVGGFNYLPVKFYLPGFICHYFTILHNAVLGLDGYDFLEGEDDYKKSLSTDYNEMEDIIVHKRGIKQIVENLMVNLYKLFMRQNILID